MGAIDLDPASCPVANRVVQATSFYSFTTDGLTQPWLGRVWCNPPYNGGATRRWVEKMRAEYAAYRIEGILLVNASTERKWFQPLLKGHPVCFTDHRIAFDSPEGTSSQPVSGNAFVYFGPDVRLFADVFSRFGTVVVAVPE